MTSTVKESPGAARLRAAEDRPRPSSPVREIALAVFESENMGIDQLEQAKGLLAEVYDIDTAKGWVDKAAAYQVYAKRAKLGMDSQNLAGEIRLRAERRAGELLASVERQTRAGAGRPVKVSEEIGVSPGPEIIMPKPGPTPYQRMLTDSEIAPTTARRWQQEASVPEDVFVQHVQAVKARHQELTSGALVKLAPKVAYEPKPVVPIDPALLGPKDRFHVGDMLGVDWPSGEVDLIVTSPPYALDIPYQGGDVPSYPEWLAAMIQWLEKMGNLLNQDHGRLCLNIPLDRDLGGWQPVSADVMHLAKQLGFKFRTWILWDKANAGAGTDRGSLDSAGAPNVTAPVESILVLYLGEWKRPGPPSMLHQTWLDFCGPRGLWQFNGVAGDEVVPAPFPEILPRLCVELFSFPGDVVADPFSGRGTTAAMAARFDRVAWAADRDPRCVVLTQEWVARERVVQTRP